MAIGIRIDQDWLDKNQNAKVDQPFFSRFLEYTGKTIGALRLLQMIKGVAKLEHELAPTPSPVLKNLEGKAGIAISGLGIVFLPGTTKDAIHRVVDLAKDTGASAERKVGLAVKDVSEAISSWIYAGIFLTGKATFLRAAQVADLASDGMDLAISTADYQKAAECEAIASGNAKEVFTHTKNYNMLRMAKAVVSVVSATLAVLMFVYQTMVVSAVALILLSLTSASLAIRRDLYKEEGRFQVVNF